MGTPAPDAAKRLIEAWDMTEVPDISDRVPSPAGRKVFLAGDYKEEQLRADFLNPRVIDFALDSRIMSCFEVRHI